MSIDFNMSSTDEDNLDVGLLITSVEERPLLWDNTLDSYSDRNDKRKRCRDIFCITKPGFEELDLFLLNKIMFSSTTSAMFETPS